MRQGRAKFDATIASALSHWLSGESGWAADAAVRAGRVANAAAGRPSGPSPRESSPAEVVRGGDLQQAVGHHRHHM